MYLSIKTKAKKIICLFRVTLPWKIGYVGRHFHFIFQKHFTFIKWGAFLDFNSAWPKILIKCVTVGNKIMVGRETLNSHIIILGTNVRGFCDNSFFLQERPVVSLVLSWWGVLYTALCDTVCQWLATGWCFFPSTLVSSYNKTDRHDITEILLKVAF